MKAPSVIHVGGLACGGANCTLFIALWFTHMAALHGTLTIDPAHSRAAREGVSQGVSKAALTLLAGVTMVAARPGAGARPAPAQQGGRARAAAPRAAEPAGAPSQQGKQANSECAPQARYEDEPFVHVMKEGGVPHTRYVRGTNYAFISVFPDRIPGRAIILCGARPRSTPLRAGRVAEAEAEAKAEVEAEREQRCRIACYVARPVLERP